MPEREPFNHPAIETILDAQARDVLDFTGHDGTRAETGEGTEFVTPRGRRLGLFPPDFPTDVFVAGANSTVHFTGEPTAQYGSGWVSISGITADGTTRTLALADDGRIKFQESASPVVPRTQEAQERVEPQHYTGVLGTGPLRSRGEGPPKVSFALYEYVGGIKQEETIEVWASRALSLRLVKNFSQTRALLKPGTEVNIFGYENIRETGENQGQRFLSALNISPIAPPKPGH